MLKDFSICFWEASDNFKFEKALWINLIQVDYQTNIWFIDFLTTWVTTGQHNCLYAWDLETECVKYKIEHPKIKRNIVDVVALPNMRLVAIASLDKHVTIWDMSSLQLILTIDLPKGGVHQLAYSSTFQVLLIAGYENNVSIYKIHPVYQDSFCEGRLIGH